MVGKNDNISLEKGHERNKNESTNDSEENMVGHMGKKVKETEN